MKLRWIVLALLASLSYQSLAEDAAAKPVPPLQSQVDAIELRLGKLESQLQNQGMLSLLNEVESLKQDVAKLKGQIEVNTYQLESLGKRQTDLYQDLDHRLTELASKTTARPTDAGPETTAKEGSAAAPASGAEAADPLAESRQYEAALNKFRAANYVGSIAGFKEFLKAYPDSTLASNAQYWIGYAYYSMHDYKTAQAQQKKFLIEFPQSSKAPDALLNIALCQEALKDASGAKKTLKDIVAKYPGTEAAAIAAKRLAAKK